MWKWKNSKNASDPCFNFGIVCTFVCLSLLFVEYMDSRLPIPLTQEDSKLNPSSFIEERARDDLHQLTSYGPRYVGSFENENITIELLMRKLQSIINNKAETQNIMVDLQRTSGSHMYPQVGTFQAYSEISNIIAKFEPSDPSKRSNYSVLLNCHYDTKDGSPGATDNMISCTTMLEMLRVLSRQDTVYKNTFVFLFNGAEEMGLLGAHGFIQGSRNDSKEIGHPWSKNLKCFINLEGAGSGGRPILFQTGPGNEWITRLYSSSVPYPFATVLAEEAFQRRLIPSDTDFRIFRDYSHIPGLDFAFVKNGWLYHTMWDSVQNIPGGCIQQHGSNTLALVEKFGNLDFDSLKFSDTENVVFFDLFGLFMVVYSETVGIIINVILALGSIGIILWVHVIKPKKYIVILKFVISAIVAWGSGIVTAVIIAVWLNGMGYYTPFHSYPTLLLLIYGVPAVLTNILIYSLMLRGNEEHVWAAGKLVLSIILLVGTFITRAVYLLTVIVLFGVTAWYSTRFLFKGFVKLRLITYIVVGELLPFNLLIYTTNVLNAVLVPSMARSGPGVKPDILLALSTGFILPAFAFNGLAAFLVAVKKRHLTFFLGFSVIILNSLIVFGFIGKIPYQQKAPMRISMVETERIWYNLDGVTPNRTDAGVILWPVDPNTQNYVEILSPTIVRLKEAKKFELDIETCEDLNCAIATARGFYSNMFWIKGESYFPIRNTKMEVIKKERVKKSTNWEIVLRFHGPTQTSIIMSPNFGFDLISWSTNLDSTPTQSQWNGRKAYHISHNSGKNDAPFEISLILNDVNTVERNARVMLDILFGSYFFYGEEKVSPSIRTFTDRFPLWTYVNHYRSVGQLYKITTDEN